MRGGPMERGIRVENDGRVDEIIGKIQLARRKLEISSFYAKFMDQMQDPEMVERIERVIATVPHHSQLQMVVYGIGKLDSHGEFLSLDQNHMQLAFAILLRERFQWVNDIVVYDPALSQIEQMAINALDCTFLSVNENGRRTVDRPTLFFMPGCPFDLFPRVLEANWTPANLNKIIILGNSFKRYKDLINYDVSRMRVILNREHVVHEFPLPQAAVQLPRNTISSLSIDADPVYKRAFNGLSWHFFVVSSDDLQS